MKKIKAGVIGLGFIGVAHIEALRRLGYVDVVAVTTRNNVNKKAETLSVNKAFEDYREMIDTMDLDTVHICTPNNTHKEMAIYALEKGIHVICEKPLCCSLEEAEEMVHAAEKSGKVAALNFHNRFYPMAYQMRQMVLDGSIGDVLSIHGSYIQDWLLYNSDFSWRVLREESGKMRAVSDIGSHWIDLAEFITGKRVTEVLAEFSIYHKKRKIPLVPVKSFGIDTPKSLEYREIDVETEDIATIMFRFEGDVIGTAMISELFAGAKNTMSIAIAGSEKSLQWNVENSNNLFIGQRNQPDLVMQKDFSLLHEKAGRLVGYPGGHGEGFPDSFKQNFNSIYRSIMGDNAPCDFATFSDGLHSTRILEKIYESAQNRCWVKI